MCASFNTFQRDALKEINYEFKTNFPNVLYIPPANFVCGRYTVFTLSVRPSIPTDRPLLANSFMAVPWLYQYQGLLLCVCFCVQEHPKAQPTVVLVLKPFRRWGHNLKSHPTNWESRESNSGLMGTRQVTYPLPHCGSLLSISKSSHFSSAT